MNSAASVLFPASLLLLLHLCTTTTTVAASSPPPPPCPTEIVMLSPCLPYISLPPNELSSTVSPQCCAAFSSIITSKSGHCLCYLLRDTSMLGFPLNTTRLISLSPDCDISTHRNTDLIARCSASPPLPPLQSTAGSEIQTNSPLNPSGALASSSAPAPLSTNHSPSPNNNSPTESEVEDADVPPPTVPSLPLAPVTNSAATIRALAGTTCTFLTAMLHLHPFAT